MSKVIFEFNEEEDSINNEIIVKDKKVIAEGNEILEVL